MPDPEFENMSRSSTETSSDLNFHWYLIFSEYQQIKHKNTFPRGNLKYTMSSYIHEMSDHEFEL